MATETQPHVPMVRPVGEVRRSQIITTYSIGSIVDVPLGSFMPMGLDDWDWQMQGGRLPSLTIFESRLQRQLGVEFFRLPPVVEEVKGQPGMVDRRYTVPGVRFPRWHECPKCHRLGVEGDPFGTDSDGNALVCGACNETTVTPVRFVRACEAGHIGDFPWVRWAHKNGNRCDRPTLFLGSSGTSASLGDLFVRCACGERASMGDAFLSENFGDQKCFGPRPWLVDSEGDCQFKMRTLQRGASNIHFPVIVSALSIPPVSEPLFQMLDDNWDVISELPESAVESVLTGIARKYAVDFRLLLEAYRQRLAIEFDEQAPSELASRAKEYLALSSDRLDEIQGGKVPQFCNRTTPPPPGLQAWFDLIGAVSRLREVRAMCGFSRIQPYPVSAERVHGALSEGKIAPLSKSRKSWLPAAEIRGEGVFLRFRTEAVDRWIRENPALGPRAETLEARSAAVAAERGYERDYVITPRYLLCHSFAHVLIRQLSLDCGYSSAALRERLYIAESTEDSDSMNGVLIYTGSPDSEGSLGGLVRLASTDLIDEVVLRAVRHARWCGSDPVCRETDPAQSGERISGAACHCCLLVPETACERFNRELDRTFLIGDAEGRWKGFFDGLGERD